MSHEIPVLRELLMLAGASLAVVMVFRRLRLPAAVGFIVTGILVGPGGLGLIGDPELVHTLAEFGVVVLLFTVGLELTLTDLGRIGRGALMAGALQVLLTVALAGGTLVIAGQHPARAVFFGLLITLSSTALVLKLLTDRLELSSPHGRLVTGILVFQDLMVIPFAIAVPWLGRWVGRDSQLIAGPGGVAEAASAGNLLRSLVQLAAVVLAFALARRAVPWLLMRAARTG